MCLRFHVTFMTFILQIVFEAMHRLLWQSFKTWLQSTKRSINYLTIVNDIQTLRKELSPGDFEKLLSSKELEEVYHLYENFKQESNGPLKEFWYLEMVSTLLTFIRATREGNWDLHLESIRAMLPWFFAYDHINYARYLPIYLVKMLCLEETHPEAHHMLANGDFGVLRSTHGFAQVPIDQTTLACPDGSLAKTNMATLPKLLEDGIQFLQSRPECTTVIIDAMAMLQTLTRIPERFSELSDMIINTVFLLAREAKRIDVLLTSIPVFPSRMLNDRGVRMVKCL